MLNDARALTVLSALAQATRLQIMRTLLRAHPAGLPAGRVAAAALGTPSTMSFHLAQLEQAGLVRSQRQATSVIYTAVPDALGDLVTYLMQECCDGRPELCAPIGAAALRSSPDGVISSCCGPAAGQK